MANPFLLFFYVINITIDGTMDLFDPQVVILEVIFVNGALNTVIGTEIGVNPHGESILTVFILLT